MEPERGAVPPAAKERAPRVGGEVLRLQLPQDWAFHTVSLKKPHFQTCRASCLVALPGAGYLEATQTLKVMAESATRRRREKGIA